MRKFWPIGVVLIALLLFVGNFHVFTGKGGINVVPRVTFSISEFWVNEDALRSMPPLAVTTQYPLAAMALLADDARAIEEASKISNK